MSRFDDPELEVHVFDFLHQLRQARKVLKSVISSKDQDKVTLISSGIDSSASDAKKRIQREFNMQQI